jgi:hypothetical protein
VLPVNERSDERPHSLTSNRSSAATIAESFSSRHDRWSLISLEQGTHKSASGPSAPGNSEPIVESSRVTSTSGVSGAASDHGGNILGLPGSLPQRSRKRGTKSSGNCVVQ